ncbi:MAG: hypothetical protein AAF039_17235 [Bacteroidota bacterium]
MDDQFDILASLKSILQESDLPYPTNLTKEKVAAIWTDFQKLLEQWKRLPFGEVLTLDFNVPSSK